MSSDATALSKASAICDPDRFSWVAGRFKLTCQKTSGTSRSLTQISITRRLSSAGTEAACLTTLLLLCFMRCVWRSPWQALPRQAPQFLQGTSAEAQACHCLFFALAHEDCPADGSTSPPVWLCAVEHTSHNVRELNIVRGVSNNVAEMVA